MSCTQCNYSYKFKSSETLPEQPQLHTVNVRFVYSLRAIGKGAEAGRVLCGIMNLSNPPTRFAAYTKTLLKAVEEVADEVMADAASARPYITSPSKSLRKVKMQSTPRISPSALMGHGRRRATPLPTAF